MRILMLKSFSYNVDDAGTFRRTLPEGLTFDEPSEVAEAAIAAGCARRIGDRVVISEEVDVANSADTEHLAGTAAADHGDDGLARVESGPAAEPVSPAPAPKRGKKADGDDVAPAEAVDPD
ncbi:MAG: hypothetical protein J0I54_20670 [Bosea sp.]|uniref:hypothetical protein n=1 Tax=unclassified Bosea (in: a-proteobacteria) TaxID=2653178 RepID=UPI000968DC67|nr:MULTISPECIES: hypothetical protein [unclassified Bosea (in: a-proteobacteria)]MBN9459054.1 hypothetical protein [Bosea sp. (in: a-proteobacteria)]OJV06207.1 MAG: hypothetical protein BGO20_08085 [Bosea sp. 67-29]